MSIAEFTRSLKTAAGQASAEKMLADFVDSSISRFRGKGNLSREASVLTQGSYETVTSTGKSKKVNLSEAFRAEGEKQGSTRLVVTKGFLEELFQVFNIQVDGASPMDYYLNYLDDSSGTKYKAKHFELYSNNTVYEAGASSNKKLTDLISSAKGSEITAVRGLNFSHAHTTKHVAYFLVYLKRFTNVTEAEKAILQLYERGHVYAQTTGRALASLGEADNILGKIVELSAYLDEESSSLKDSSVYGEVRARARKDFTSSRLFMNVELQLKSGNQETGKISNLLRVVGFLQSLIDNVKTSRDGARLLSTPKAASLKTLEKQLSQFLAKIEKTDTDASKELQRLISVSSNPDFLLNLKTSDSIKKYITDIITDSIISGSSNNKLKANTGDVLISSIKPKGLIKPNANLKGLISEVSTIQKNVKKLKAELTRSVKLPKLRNVQTGKFTSLASLQSLLNQALTQQIKRNMGNGGRKDILNLRSGRFAESVKVERMSQSREGMISAFYSYMKYPYQTFEPGFKQGRPASRDPKLLISKSIREIAATMVGNKLRAVRL